MVRATVPVSVLACGRTFAPMANMPSIPKGTRDFSPQEMLRRKYIFRTIETVFQK